MVQQLFLQIVALSRVYLLDVRGRGWGGGDDKANDYLSEWSARGLESCFGVACTAWVTGG